jgi:hypothetical protein
LSNPADYIADMERWQQHTLAGIKRPETAKTPIHHHLRRWGVVAVIIAITVYTAIVYFLSPESALAMGPSGLMALVLLYMNFSERARQHIRQKA